MKELKWHIFTPSSVPYMEDDDTSQVQVIIMPELKYLVHERVKTPLTMKELKWHTLVPSSVPYMGDDETRPVLRY